MGCLFGGESIPCGGKFSRMMAIILVEPMKATALHIPTFKEAPADAEIISHQLMTRAGMIRKLAGGIYTYMPLGLRVIRRIEAIIREEMDAAGAIELLMPVVQPAELWMESGRWEAYGPELLRIRDRHDRDFVIQPTSEEVITDIARQDLRSYRQLPKNFYHIQTKFRDERRPRFGVMRGREFTMKDAYSFDRSPEAALESYRRMFDAYVRIFDRLGLTYRAVAADTGSIGGSASLSKEGGPVRHDLQKRSESLHRRFSHAVRPPLRGGCPGGSLRRPLPQGSAVRLRALPRGGHVSVRAPRGVRS